MIGMIGRKIGMTQIFTEKGFLLPVTVIEAGPCPVVQVKTPPGDEVVARKTALEPEQIDASLTVSVGVGLTVTVTVKDVPMQFPAAPDVGVTV